MKDAGLRVPSQIASDLKQGFFLMEDMGDVLLSSQLDRASVDAWYGMALTDLATLSTIPPSVARLPSMDYEQIAKELAVFPEWFLGGLLGMPDSEVPSGFIHELTVYLADAFSAQFQCVVHRDFHCRNLMCLGDGALGVIDFQDAVIGPITYDPVSLLKDCYVLWHRDDQLRWLELYRQRLKSLGLSIDESSAFQVGFDMSGLQRHLRVLGVFARLNLRDGKSAYLNDLPLVLHYVREVLALYNAIPALRAFSGWFEADIMPKITRQAWYAEIAAPVPLELVP
jgi:aminoglycoside/choline kinase family phosphotransferase